MNIKLQDISRIYRKGKDEIKALKEVNMNIPAQTFTIIFGSSGAGKTTFLNIIAGIEEPSWGKVFFDDLDYTRLSESQRADFRLDSIGFIFQDFNLISGLTVRENISLPLINFKDKKEIMHKTSFLMDKVGIAHRQDSLPYSLSCGEKQKVAVVRAIANHPKILLADEPTSNLDDESAQKIIQILYELNQKDKTTIILCTNSSELARQNCDRLYRIEAGRLS